MDEVLNFAFWNLAWVTVRLMHGSEHKLIALLLARNMMLSYRAILWELLPRDEQYAKDKTIESSVTSASEILGISHMSMSPCPRPTKEATSFLAVHPE